MKGISTTLIIIVTAIVILVAALVVLTIFGSGIQPIVDITVARNTCLQQAGVTCTASNQMPVTWTAALQYRDAGVVVIGSCKVAAGCSSCGECFPIT